MPIQYKIDVLEALKNSGYTTYRLRKDKIMGERTIQQLRDGVPVSWEIVSRVCHILKCQPGDIFKYVE